MLVMHNRIRGLRALVSVAVGRKLLQVPPRGRMPCIMVMVAVGVGYDMVCVRLVVLKLIGVVLQKCRVEVLLLVRPVSGISRCT